MTRIVRETTVRAPPGRVFQALTDPHERARWIASMRETGEGGPLEVGRVLEARRTSAASRSQYRLTVRRLEPPRLLEMDIARNGEPAARGGYELSPNGDGTLVRAYAEYELKGLQKLAAPMVASGMEQELTVDLASLKRFVETA